LSKIHFILEQMISSGIVYPNEDLNYVFEQKFDTNILLLS